MYLFYRVKGILLLSLSITIQLAAQQKLSIDLGTIRQKNHHNTGVNVSSFYHFNEQVLGGMEVNRFFPVHRLINEEEETISGWDVEINMHYLLPISKGWKCYFITGASHTSEKEINDVNHLANYERFWSANTGAGMLKQMGKWLPHVEYIFSWGRTNQQFVLFGVGYEIEWDKHKVNREGHK
jgi:hypothetical protein